MNKHVLAVPKGIRFLSDWKGFRLFNFPYIIDKQITGCGFTEWSIRSGSNTIICSPRICLLKNKYQQYLDRVDSGEVSNYKLYYAENKWEIPLDIDKTINPNPNQESNIKQKFSPMMSPSKKLEYEASLLKLEADRLADYQNGVKDFWNSCQSKDGSVPCKILVTYDSFGRVKEALESIGAFDNFNVVVDEFQSVFVDSRFKAESELQLVNQLQGVDKVCYVSATPMMDKYLEQIDEFKDLPYLKLDWGIKDETRITHPVIRAHSCDSMVSKAVEIVKKYKEGSWRDIESNKKVLRGNNGELVEVESREAVLYFNSVKNMCDVIKGTKLTLDDCNILCADTVINKRKIKKALGTTKRKDIIGTIPGKGQPRKMITLCTRTVYLGADFYSDNARSFVFSDSNVNCLSVDISLDLPQILGRQRLDSNPWKNTVDIYFKTLFDINKWTDVEIKKFIDNKKSKTELMLGMFDDMKTPERQELLVGMYKMRASTNSYVEDYTSISKKDPNNPVPVFNKLIELSDLRAFEISRTDYSDRCCVLSAIDNKFGLGMNPKIKKVIAEFDKLIQFTDKMKYLCESLDNIEEDNKEIVLRAVPDVYSNYYISIGPNRCKARSYRRSYLEEEYNKLQGSNGTNLDDQIYNEFKEGTRVTKTDIKTSLQNIYDTTGYKSTAKASDLGDWFELKDVKIKTSTGKSEHGFELIKRRNL